jgi:hypothetical protein
MKRNQVILIAGVLVVGAIAYAGYKIIKKNREAKANADSNFSNASGQIGAEPCSSPNDAVCKSACERMGGYYEGGLGSRKCFKNGVAISGGVFGGRRAMRQTR